MKHQSSNNSNAPPIIIILRRTQSRISPTHYLNCTIITIGQTARLEQAVILGRILSLTIKLIQLHNK